MGQGVLTPGVARVDGRLECDGVSLHRVAEAVGTPVYVYSAETIRDRYRRLDAALAGVTHRIHYSLKANSNGAVLRVIRALGGAADVVSLGELYRARAAGFEPEDIVFGGVGKTVEELRFALQAGVLLINAESEAEVRLIDSIAGELNTRGRISLRVNPELTLDAAHDYIKTGGRGHKFGIPHDEVPHVARLTADLPNVDLVGLDMHLGSQLTGVEPYRLGTERLIALLDALLVSGIDTLRYLDIGGGLGVRYEDEPELDLERFAALVVPLVAATGLVLLVEPGRFLVGNAGVLLTTVLFRKHSGGKEYVVVDAGMTELLRPSHYGAFHAIEPVGHVHGTLTADVVGPVCESGDFLARDRAMADVLPGETLAVRDVGAYGSAMASNYNSRRRAAEVLVDDGRFATASARESYDDLTRLEIDVLDWRH